MMRQSAQPLFALCASLGYLCLIAYFGLMAYDNFFGETPSHLVGTVATAACILFLWRLIDSIKRVIRGIQCRKEAE